MSEDIEIGAEDFVIRTNAAGQWEALTGDDEVLGVFHDNQAALTIIAQAMMESGEPSNLFYEEDDEYELLDDFDPVKFVNGAQRRASGRGRPSKGEAPRRPRTPRETSAPRPGGARRRRGKRRHLNVQALRRAAQQATTSLQGMGESLSTMIRNTQEAP